MPFMIVRNDITQMDTDAIVNAANTELLPGGGVCGAIFKAAGYDKLAAACRRIGHCDTGAAVITKGYGLKAKYIIHTAGPYYRGGKYNEEPLLYSCYRSSLEMAKKHQLKSIAFPLISSGIYGYPKIDALRVATRAVTDFLADNEMYIYLAVYDKSSFEVSEKLFCDVKNYMDARLMEEAEKYNTLSRYYDRSRDIPYEMMSDMCCERAPMPKAVPIYDAGQDFDMLFRNMDKGFSEYLMELIDRSGRTDADVYKSANIDRKHFSKIRKDPQYKPKKQTAAAFAIALRLDLCDTRELLARAGYSLTHSSKFDIIIEYFIQHKNYDIYEINEVLFSFDQPLIGA